MFGGKPFAGAGKTRLNFIGDEQDAVLAANFLQQGKIVARRNNETAFAEDRFSDNRSDRLGRDGALEGVLKVMSKRFGCGALFSSKGISVRDAVDVAGEGFE